MGFLAPLIKVAGLASGGTMGAGTILATGGQLLGGILQNQANARQAQRQMDFQAYQSNTAHQREVEDLRQAGLNPILSGTGGMGAATGAGASAQMTDPLGSAVSTAQAARRLESDINLLNAQEEQTVEAAGNQRSQRFLNNQLEAKALAEKDFLETTKAKAEQETKTEALRTQGQQIQNRINQHEATIRGASAVGAAREGEIDKSTPGEILRWINRTMRSIRGGVSH